MTAATATRPKVPAGTADRVMEILFPSPHPYAADPVGYCRDVLRFEPWSKQRQILESVRDNRRTAVRSCHGAGKTAVAARAALWFLATHPGDTRVITTGMSWDGVKNLLWKEIHEAYHLAAGAIGGKLTETYLDLGQKWFATGLSTDKPERFQGHHADHLLLIVDEASGVGEKIFEAASGYLTGDARLLLIGNPTQLAGEFHAAFHSKRDQYDTIAVSAFDTPAFTGEAMPDTVESSFRGLPTYVDEMRALYGEESAVWQVRVLGQFPSTADDTVCSLTDVEAAQARQLPERETVEPVVVGCDVARFGSDETVITIRHGNRVRIVRRYVGKDTMATVGEILQVARAAHLGRLEGAPAKPQPEQFMRIVVDDAGVGGGVTDRLREIDEFPVYAFNAGNAARTSDYPNRRSELWFQFSELLPQLDLDQDDQLAADLVAPKYQLDSHGRRVVEQKHETKKRLGRSPDRADAVMLTFAAPPAFRLPEGYEPPPDRSLTDDLMDVAM